MNEDLVNEEQLREQIAGYLDGTLRSRDRAALERLLVEPEVSRMFAEELLLRDLLRHAPPDVPPDEVVARWEAALMGELESLDDAPGWFGQALDSLGWTVRGPALSVNALAGAGFGSASSGADSARTGLGTLRYTVPRREKAPKAPLWRRLLLRRLKKR